MSKVVKKVFSLGIGPDPFKEKKTGQFQPDVPDPDELAADAADAERRKRRGALGRASTITSETLGSANVGASLLSGR